MSTFRRRTLSADGLELAFALQYVARAVIDRLCADALAASGDGRVVHVAGAVPRWMARPNLDDPNFEHRRWSFFKAILPMHVIGFEFLEEASRRWADRPISLYAAGMPPTTTKVMQDPGIPLVMRAMARFGTTSEKAARPVIHLLSATDAPRPRAGLVKPGKTEVQPFGMPHDEAARVWAMTDRIGAEQGVRLPG